MPEAVRAVIVLVSDGESDDPGELLARIADALSRHGFATLRVDPRTPREAEDGDGTVDVELLSRRVLRATRWLADEEKTRALPIGYLGTGAGTAAALIASARSSHPIGAVVSGTGRPELAGPLLLLVSSATLLIVPEKEPALLDANREALETLHCKRKLAVVPEGDETPGSLAREAELAVRWFAAHVDRRP